MRDSALLLVGHGSTRIADAARPVLDLAERIRSRGHFAEVGAVFMKQVPRLDQAWLQVKASRVVVVPVFAGTGYYTEVLIPQALGLNGPVSRVDGRTVLYTQPAGSHPRIPELIAGRAERIAAAEGLRTDHAALLLLAHGSSRPGGAGATPRAIAAAIAARNRFGEVAVAFLEQEPWAESWPSLVTSRDVIALPLLVAQGAHASQDIPPLFGLRAGESGPIDIAGHRVRLAAGLGAEADLVDIILEMAGAAERNPQ